MKLNYTSLQHPVEPVERPVRVTPRRWHERRTKAAAPMPVLVLPLHGHLAPAAWAAAQAGAGVARSATCRRGRGAAGLAQPRRRRAARARPALRPRHRGARLRRRARGDLGRRRPRRRRHGLGWDAVLAGPGPGIIGSDTELGHGGIGRPRHAPTRRSPSACRRCSRRASPPPTPASATAAVSHHTLTVLELLLGAGRGRRSPTGEAVADRRPSTEPQRPVATACARRPPTSRLRGLRPAGADDGPRRSTRTRSSSPPPLAAGARRCAARD